MADVSAAPAITVYRNPGRRGYRTVQLVRCGEPLSPLAFPDVALDTDALLG